MCVPPVLTLMEAINVNSQFVMDFSQMTPQRCALDVERVLHPMFALLAHQDGLALYVKLQYVLE